jgi:hypothetical protein
VAAILSPQTLALFLVFSVPGIVALYFRAQFLSGRLPPAAEGFISYITLSLVYHAVVYPLAAPLYIAIPPTGWKWLAWCVLIFIGPAILGILLGLNIRKGWTKKIINQFGVSTIHPVNCAWDWHFGQCVECWVIVKLKDGSSWGGFLGAKSFMSSDSSERDLFIEQVYEVKDGEPWGERGSSVWIAHGEIQTLEFLPYDRSVPDA